MVYWIYIQFSCWCYIGFDNPKTLGKFETGSKVALPIFKNFIEKSFLKKILMNLKFLKIFI